MDDSPPPPPPDAASPPAAPPASSSLGSGSPNEFLKAIVGKEVVVRLLSGVDYRGKTRKSSMQMQIVLIRSAGVLSCLDGYMNIALEQTVEYVNGKVTNRYGDAFIRGNNGTFVCPG
jgi:U6 snRNA-associated Sm-like protein LSm6